MSQNPDISYANDPWIRNNTIADIAYMSDTLSGTIDPDIIAKLNSELDATIIEDNTDILAALLNIADPIENSDSANLLNEENQVVTGEDPTMVNTYKAKRFHCKKK